MPDKQWDVFISHASEDKAALVEPLAKALRNLGAEVWYDAFTLTVGDSLSRSIDHGLAQARFGVVVLSPAFFAKDWPVYELRGLLARELGRDKVILPIWHHVTRDDVLQYSPPLADKFALTSVGSSSEELAIQLLEVIRPDIYQQVHRRAAPPLSGVQLLVLMDIYHHKGSKVQWTWSSEDICVSGGRPMNEYYQDPARMQALRDLITNGLIEREITVDDTGQLPFHHVALVLTSNGRMAAETLSAE